MQTREGGMIARGQEAEKLNSQDKVAVILAFSQTTDFDHILNISIHPGTF